MEWVRLGMHTAGEGLEGGEWTSLELGKALGQMMAFEEGSEGLRGYGEQTRRGLLDRRGRVCTLGRSVLHLYSHST